MAERMIDKLGLDGRKVRSLEALHRKVNDPWAKPGRVSQAQFVALKAAYAATVAKGLSTPEFDEHAKKLGLV